MTSADPNRRSGAESVAQDRARTGRETASQRPGRLKRGLTSGVVAGLGGGLVLWSGLRALRRGRRRRGVAGLIAGVVLIAVGARQRQSGGERGGPGADVGQRDVVDTGPDVEDVDDAGLDEGERASGEAARQVTEAAVEIEDVSEGVDESTGEEGAGEEENAAEGTGVQVDFETEADEPEEWIGEGAFDEREGVPVPEQAVDEGFLLVEEAAFWGIRDRDDAVFVSHSEAVFEEGDGVEYVTSSDVDEAQLLSVPEVVLDHWEDVGDDAAVSDGDDIVFATSDDLRRGGVLWIVSADRADEFADL